MPYWDMDRHSDSPLTPQEFASLREVGLEMLQREIPEEHREKLTGLGLIVFTFDGLRVTPSGQMRLARGNEGGAARVAVREYKEPGFFSRWW
jgi:hypothetical protein